MKNEISMRFLMPQLNFLCSSWKKSQIAINEHFSLLMGVNQNQQKMWLEELSFLRFIDMIFVQKMCILNQFSPSGFRLEKANTYLSILRQLLTFPSNLAFFAADPIWSILSSAVLLT